MGMLSKMFGVQSDEEAKAEYEKKKKAEAAAGKKDTAVGGGFLRKQKELEEIRKETAGYGTRK